jgi:hypothetical protein
MESITSHKAHDTRSLVSERVRGGMGNPLSKRYIPDALDRGNRGKPTIDQGEYEYDRSVSNIMPGLHESR